MSSWNKLVVQLFVSSCLIFLQISVSLADGDGRIVGGHTTDIQHAPYLVQIKNEGRLLCGGTLVTRRHVVTAAHCFKHDPQDLLVVGGATKITDSGTARSKVAGYIKHEAFNEKTYDMDIAVIKLATPLKGRLIKPIRYNCRQDWKVGQTVRLFGWGQLSEDSETIPIDLQTVDVKVVSKKKCARIYRFDRKITESMVCAAAYNKDSCSGDSGGPAIINRQFCGVISWATGCAQEGVPGVYTNIKVVKDVIQEFIRKLDAK